MNDKEALAAVKKIKEYCEERYKAGCVDCIFYGGNCRLTTNICTAYNIEKDIMTSEEFPIKPYDINLNGLAYVNDKIEYC